MNANLVRYKGKGQDIPLSELCMGFPLKRKFYYAVDDMNLIGSKKHLFLLPFIRNIYYSSCPFTVCDFLNHLLTDPICSSIPKFLEEFQISDLCAGEKILSWEVEFFQFPTM